MRFIGVLSVSLALLSLNWQVVAAEHWQTTLDESGKGAQLGLVEEGSQEYGSRFYANCRPLDVRIQFDDAVNAKIVGPDVYPMLIFVVDGKRMDVGFDTLKWSDVPGGWQIQAVVDRATMAAISRASGLSVEVVDNSHKQKLLGKIEYTADGLDQGFASFMKACF